jgi:hypothetical protein
MKFKTPAPLFNVNGERTPLAYKLIQDPMIIDESILYYQERLLSVVGALIVKE